MNLEHIWSDDTVKLFGVVEFFFEKFETLIRKFSFPEKDRKMMIQSNFDYHHFDHSPSVHSSNKLNILLSDLGFI